MKQYNVLWIASYPKSGNTWIHSVLRAAGARHGFPPADLDVYNIARTGRDLLPCPAVSGTIAAQPCAVLKTHSAWLHGQPMHAIEGYELRDAAFIHIYRNPLDALLSYINYSRLAYKANVDNPAFRKTLFKDLLGFDEPYGYDDWLAMSLDTIPRANLDHALDSYSDSGMMLPTTRGAGSWIANTESWLEAAKVMPGCSVRYEDCLADRSHITQLARFFTFGEEDVGKALDFINTRVRTGPASKTPDNAIFYNKMSAYYFREYFSAAAIERFMAKNERAMKVAGYDNLLA